MQGQRRGTGSLSRRQREREREEAGKESRWKGRASCHTRKSSGYSEAVEEDGKGSLGCRWSLRGDPDVLFTQAFDCLPLTLLPSPSDTRFPNFLCPRTPSLPSLPELSFRFNHRSRAEGETAHSLSLSHSLPPRVDRRRHSRTALTSATRGRLLLEWEAGDRGCGFSCEKQKKREKRVQVR